jgi:peroxiredoxin family protein
VLHKITLGLCDILCGTHFYIGTVYANGKEVRVFFTYSTETDHWVITDITLFEGANTTNIYIDPAMPLVPAHALCTKHQLYSTIEKVTYIVYLNIDVLVLTYNCSGIVTNILYQILSEGIAKSTESLIHSLRRTV